MKFALFILASWATFRPTQNIGFLSSYLNYGRILQISGQQQKAIEQYKRALIINPESTYAHFYMGTILDQKNLIEEALYHYKQAIRIQKNYAPVRNNIGVLMIKTKNWDEAEFQLLKAIKIQPNYIEAHYNLGIIYAKKGDQRKANMHSQLAKDLSRSPLKP